MVEVLHWVNKEDFRYWSGKFGVKPEYTSETNGNWNVQKLTVHIGNSLDLTLKAHIPNNYETWPIGKLEASQSNENKPIKGEN